MLKEVCVHYSVVIPTRTSYDKLDVARTSETLGKDLEHGSATCTGIDVGYGMYIYERQPTLNLVYPVNAIGNRLNLPAIFRQPGRHTQLP
jgi:hypothetical protein